MTLQDILAKCDGLEINEKRVVEDEYVEIVFLTDDLQQWYNRLINIFGQPVKPIDANPSKEHDQFSKNYGGVRSNQTLFQNEIEGMMFGAMFWPWSNETFITLKLWKI